MLDQDGGVEQSAAGLRIALFLAGDQAGEGLIRHLAADGWQCVNLPSPATGMRAWLGEAFDLLLVSPFCGWEDPVSLLTLCRAIAGNRPVMALTWDVDVGQRLAALQAGLDDVIHRLADLREINARLRGLVRRHQLASGWLRCAELEIDLIGRGVSRAGRSMRLPLREFDLLTNLARTPDHIVSRATLLRAVWRIDFDPGTNNVEVHMSRLRAKVDRGFGWAMIVNARGVGYGLRTHREFVFDAAQGAA